MGRAATAVVLAAMVAFAAAACGPAQCYNGCTDARPVVDFLLLVDDSGSMDPYKTGIVNGLNTWAQSLSQMNAAYAIVSFGTPSSTPKVVQSMTTNFASFKTKLSSGISLSGYWEAGLEALRCVAGTANTANIHNSIGWRSGATRILIMMTDEDSDPAMYSANRFQSSSNCDSLCRYSTYGATTMTASVWNTYQQDINAAVAAIKAVDFKYVYMLVDTSGGRYSCNTYSQYGNPAQQVQNTDFTGFNIVATATAVSGSDVTKDSIQGQLLRSSPQIPTRVFKVTDASKSTFVTNFFAAVTADISQCDKCLSYPCSNNMCQDPVNICDCEGKPYGSKVVDCAGVCGGNAVRDCAGVCKGTAEYDTCGVCVPKGTTSSQCKTDCAGNLFMATAPATGTAFKKSCDSVPSWFNTATRAGYVVASSDLQAQKWTEEQVCEHFRGYGQFERRKTCTFDAAYYVSANSYGGVTTSNAAAHFLSTGNKAGAAARCTANTQVDMPPRASDNCNQCVANPLSPPFCQKDCKGDWKTSASAMAVVDDCGVCDGKNAAKDDCGVCNGNNAAKNECGQCFGIRGKDGCDNDLCLANKPECYVDCNNDPYQAGTDSPHVRDECEQCVPRQPGRHASCVQDCSGTWFLNNTVGAQKLWVDPCGNCIDYGTIAETCVQDCAGVYDGEGYLDECGQCISPHATGTVESCVADCDGEFYKDVSDTSSPHFVDDCGQCVVRADTASHNALKDNCGVCTNLPGYNTTAECIEDCLGVWRAASDPEHAVRDDCGECIGFHNLTWFNYLLSDCGGCVPLEHYDNETYWNQGKLKDTEGNFCSCGTEPKQCANGHTSCQDCPPPNTCAGGIPKDACGHCPGDSMYNKVDSCGACCGDFIVGDTTIPGITCNADLDDCGICYGLNANKTTNICNICDASKCVTDCAGVPFGPAVYDCAGICGGRSVCAVCGNGVVEEGEACDEGAANGSGACTVECTAVSGELTGGQIAGAVIGAIAAVALIAALALFAWRYAVSNGLFGAAKKSVDMGASNSNPLYESETKIASNPLYAGN